MPFRRPQLSGLPGWPARATPRPRRRVAFARRSGLLRAWDTHLKESDSRNRGEGRSPKRSEGYGRVASPHRTHMLLRLFARHVGLHDLTPEDRCIAPGRKCDREPEPVRLTDRGQVIDVHEVVPASAQDEFAKPFERFR